jgi:hypothetical protein
MVGMADERIYVVAPTRAQYDEYYHRTCDLKIHSRTTFYWIKDADCARGLRNPKGIFVGNWKLMPDIIEIVDRLQICWNFQNKALIKIREDLTNIKRSQNLIVTFNGIVQHPVDYSVVGDTLTLVNPSNEMVLFDVKHATGIQLAQGNILPNGTLSIAL